MTFEKKQYTRPPERYTYQKSDFNLIKTADNVGLYQQAGRRDHFEVIMLNKAGEFPSPNRWGTYGFTFWDRSAAEERFCRLAGLPIVKRLTDERTRLYHLNLQIVSHCETVQEIRHV